MTEKMMISIIASQKCGTATPIMEMKLAIASIVLLRCVADSTPMGSAMATAISMARSVSSRVTGRRVTIFSVTDAPFRKEIPKSPFRTFFSHLRY